MVMLEIADDCEVTWKDEEGMAEADFAVVPGVTKSDIAGFGSYVMTKDPVPVSCVVCVQ